METCTRAQIRELDRLAIEEYGIPGVVLMENAGRGAAEIAVEMLGDPKEKRVLIFCGKGNNGGDGFVIARHLHNRGARVELVLAFAPDDTGEGDAAVNLRIVQNMGIPIHVVGVEDGRLEAAGLEPHADLIVDALLGTGLTGDVREPYLGLIRLINAADKPILSVDIPSGLDADDGHILRAAVRATATAAFVLPKQGFTMAEGPAHIGKLHVVDIGAPVELIERVLS